MEPEQIEMLGRIDERTENYEKVTEILFKNDKALNERIDDLEEERIRPLEKWRWILTGAFIVVSGIGSAVLAVMYKWL